MHHESNAQERRRPDNKGSFRSLRALSKEAREIFFASVVTVLGLMVILFAFTGIVVEAWMLIATGAAGGFSLILVAGLVAASSTITPNATDSTVSTSEEDESRCRSNHRIY